MSTIPCDWKSLAYPDIHSSISQDKMGSLDAETIPTVDISPFVSSNASQESLDDVVQAVRHACTTYGFFQLVGHGVSRESQAEILECAKRFFELPMEEKMEVQLKNSMGKSFRGYEPPGIQVHQKGLKADTKEVRLLYFFASA